MIMAKMGNVRHIKSLNAPLFFGIHRKGNIYVTKPNPGRHSLPRSVSLSLMLERLSLASNNSDAERVLKSGKILVNSKPVKEPHYPVGLNDAIEIKGENRYFRVGVNNKGRMSVEETKKPDYESMLYKVTGKYKAPSSALMLRLNDGRVVKGKKEINVNDSVMINLKGEVSKVLKLDVGARCIVADGVHVGSSGSIKGLVAGTLHRRQSVTVQQSDGKEFDTLVKNIMVTE
jgi:small subunit ribosomal protein S4e